MKEFYFPTRQNTRIHCCQWIPSGRLRGVIQIVHGIAEYAARYDALAQFFNQQGFAVVAEDHMGHGGSISRRIPKGCLAGGWLAAVSDTYRLLQITREEYPGLPYILYGHSMGSFLARTLLYTHPDAQLSAAVISGTAWIPRAILRSGEAVCLLEGKRKGWNATSSLIDRLLFGSYQRGYQSPRTPWDWLTREEAVVDDYIANPLLGFSPSIGLVRQMLRGMEMNEAKQDLIKMPKDLPVLFISGAQDPVGDHGKGVRKSWEAFRTAGMQDVGLKLYPEARHELHNELDREALHRDLLAFFDHALSKQK